MKMKLILAVAVLLWSNYANGDPYDDSQNSPCIPPHAGLFSGLIGALTEKQREAACVAYRKSQWDDYNAKQKVAQDQADAAKAEELRQQREQAKVELASRWASYNRLMAEESSPDNFCRKPEIARGIIDDWNHLDTFSENNLRAIDIEHLTTTALDANTGTMSCHGIFVTNRAGRVIGTVQIKRNVAGDPMVTWVPDLFQGTSAYDPPPEMEPAPAVVSARVPAPVEKPASPANPAFASGLSDRQATEAWLAGLTGDERAGATWWAANRSVPHHQSCATATVTPGDKAAWSAGCLNAQIKLTPIDLRRRADPEYKRGWNSF